MVQRVNIDEAESKGTARDSRYTTKDISEVGWDERVFCTFGSFDWDNNQDWVKRVVKRWYVNAYKADYLDAEARTSLNRIFIQSKYKWDDAAQKFRNGVALSVKQYLLDVVDADTWNTIPNPAFVNTEIQHLVRQGEPTTICGRSITDNVVKHIEWATCKQCRSVAEKLRADRQAKADAILYSPERVSTFDSVVDELNIDREMVHTIDADLFPDVADVVLSWEPTTSGMYEDYDSVGLSAQLNREYQQRRERSTAKLDRVRHASQWVA